jgi:hypothetical protein
MPRILGGRNQDPLGLPILTLNAAFRGVLCDAYMRSDDFSPYGTQVKLFDLPANALLPKGAARPAKTGTVQVGPDQKAWIKILATSDSALPAGSMPALH